MDAALRLLRGEPPGDAVARAQDRGGPVGGLAGRLPCGRQAGAERPAADRSPDDRALKQAERKIGWKISGHSKIALASSTPGAPAVPVQQPDLHA